MIRVYHIKDSVPFPTKLKMGDLQLVAEVETTVLDEAYELTNSIHCPWWENEGVKYLNPCQGCRSTSVGDVLVRKISESTIPRYFIVDTIGFIEVENFL